MNVAPQVEELIQLLGGDVLLLPWPWGKKGDKRRWKHLTAAAMSNPAHLRRLGEGNIGVAQGRVSGGLCSLDIDSDEAMDEFLSLNPEISNTLRSRGKRGCNLWWRVVGGYPPLTPIKQFSTGWGEWRSTGAQTIIYGQHPDGHDYQIINRVEPIEIELIQINWPDGILPLLQGGSFVNDTERTEPTELPERTEQPEGTERTEANRSGMQICGVVSMIKNHDDAVKVSLPTTKHQNHERLFTLARAIKALGMAEGRDIPLTEMKKIFLKWHSHAMPFLDPSQSVDDYWFELLEGYENATHAFGVDFITNAWDAANSKEPPSAAQQFASNEVRLLVSFCRELQILCGDKPFFLASRTVQRLFALDSHATGARWLKGLCRSGILKVTEQGGRDTNKATRFRYEPPL